MGKRRGKRKWQAAPIESRYTSVWAVPKLAFKLGNREVWGGPGRAMLKQEWALLICCSDYTPSPTVYINPAALKFLPAQLATPARPYMTIDWPDMDAPEMDAEFWAMLLQSLRTYGKPGRIGVCCIGGHGRTGTALTILATMANVVPKEECPVAYIRRVYDRESVESAAQIRYIELMTGAKVSSGIGSIWSQYSRNDSVKVNGTSGAVLKSGFYVNSHGNYERRYEPGASTVYDGDTGEWNDDKPSRIVAASVTSTPTLPEVDTWGWADDQCAEQQRAQQRLLCYNITPALQREGPRNGGPC